MQQTWWHRMLMLGVACAGGIGVCCARAGVLDGDEQCLAAGAGQPEKTEIANSGWVMFEARLSRTALSADESTSVRLTGSGATVRFRSDSSELLGRTGGELDLVRGVRLNVGLSDLVVNRGSAVGSLNLAGVERPSGSKLADATLEADVASFGPLTLSTLGGGRGAMLDSPSSTGASSSTPIAVAGAGLNLKLDETTSVRGSSLTSVEPLGGAPYLEAKVGAAFRLRDNSELSVGLQHLSGTLPVLDRRGDVRRNALVFEYKIAF